MKSVLSVIFGTSLALTLSFISAVAEECNVINMSSPLDELKISWQVLCIGTISEVPAQGWTVEGGHCCLAGIGPFSWPVYKSEGVHGHEKVLQVAFSHGCPWIPIPFGTSEYTPPLTFEPICRCCLGRGPCAGAEGERLAVPAPRLRTRHPPKVHSPGVVRMERGQVASISVQVLDKGGDLRAVFWTQPRHGTVKGEQATFSGSISEYSIQLQYFPPTSCWSGWDSFEVRALDASGNFSKATVRVQVADVPPQLDQPSIFVVTVDGEPVTFELPAATAPPYSSDDLTYTAIRKPLHGVLQGSGRQYTFIPDSSYCWIDVLEYFVEDPCGARSYGRVELVVHRRPLIHRPSEIKAQRGRRTTFDVLVYDPCHGFPQVTVTADSGTQVSIEPVFWDAAGGDGQLCICHLKRSAKTS